MDAIFFKKNIISLFLLAICGLCFIGLYVFLEIVDSEAPNQLISFLIIGILLLAVVIPSWLLNFGAYLHIEGDTIQARYHWFGKLDCTFRDVDYAVARFNTLVIHLKNGKTHTIMGIQNPEMPASVIRRNMSFDPVISTTEAQKEIKRLCSERDRNLLYTGLCILLMFVNIFITVFLTGGKEMYDFSTTDWGLFSIMAVVEFVTIIATFYFAVKPARYIIPIEKLQYKLRRTIIENRPPMPGFIVAIYTDEHYTSRVTLFGYPNQDTVYYSVQELDANYNLLHVYTSDTYESAIDLPEEFEAFIDITDVM